VVELLFVEEVEVVVVVLLEVVVEVVVLLEVVVELVVVVLSDQEVVRGISVTVDEFVVCLDPSVRKTVIETAGGLVTIMSCSKQDGPFVP